MAEHILIDQTMLAAGDWPFYVVDPEEDDDGWNPEPTNGHDPRAVECDGEWRIYFETLAEAEAETGLTLAPWIAPPPEPEDDDNAS